MGFSEQLLADGAELWDAQKDHPFVTDLADGTVDEAAFRHWIETYTSEAFREVLGLLRDVVDTYGERYPGQQAAMREAFLTFAASTGVWGPGRLTRGDRSW